MTLAALLSCGGAGRELPRVRPSAMARALIDGPLRKNIAAVAAMKSGIAPRHSSEPTPALDAWAEHVAGEAAAERAGAQRFPLQGIAFHVLAQVYSEPSARGEVVGYLRRGAVFRAAKGQRGSSCDERWHELSVGGFVCAGRGFLIGDGPQTFDPSPSAPMLYAPLPYRYAKNTAKAAMQYWRIPTLEESNAAEQLLGSMPALSLQNAGLIETPTADAGVTLPEPARMAMEPGFYVSVDRDELDGERAFVRTVRGAYVDAAALADVTTADAPGVELKGESLLPLGIVYRGTAKTFERDVLTGELHPTEPLRKFASIALTDGRLQNTRQSLRIARAGTFVSEQSLRIVEAAPRPALVPKNARFIRVSLAQQTLIAYDGPAPVFATLVSTGKEGFETPLGLFRIQQKHVSATMDGLVGSDEAYSIEDVPWTMYFTGSFALHAAFWHDHFGNVRSHGCVNLAPADARWLFQWATPVLPNTYHGVVAQRDNPGTWVAIDP